MQQSHNERINWALLVVRVVIGVVFAAHGGQKLFEFGISGVTGAFAGMGIPVPAVAAPLVTFVEFLGGIALATGAFARIASVFLALNMLGAMLLVHISNGFFLPTGFEYTLVLLAVSVSFAITGAGAYSIDALRQKNVSRVVKPALA